MVARRAFRAEIGPGLVGLVGEIAAEADYAAREIAVGTTLNRLLGPLAYEIASEAVDIVAEVDPDSVILVHLSTAGATDLAVMARARLEERGLAPECPLLRVVEASSLGGPVEPSSALIVLCEREGLEGAQALSFVIEERLSGGAVKDGFATELHRGRGVIETMRGRLPEGAVLEQLDPAEAHRLVVAAASRGARAGWRPSDDGLLALRIFLRATRDPDADAIVHLLETAEPFADRIAEIEGARVDREIGELVDAARVWFEAGGYGNERRVQAEDAVGLMTAFAYGDGDVPLALWSESEVDEFMLEWMPGEISMDSDPGSFAQGVADAIAFLAATDRLSSDVAVDLAGRALANSDAYVELMNDRVDVRGGASGLVRAMLADGVEIEDRAATQAWIERFNDLSREERDAILGPLPSPRPGPPRPAPARKSKARKAQKQARRRNRGR